MAAATATGVLLGIRFAVAAAWVVAAFCLTMACLGAGSVSRLRDESGSSTAVVGVLVFSTLLASGGAAAAMRATAVSDGILLSGARQPARVEVTATVAEEPHQVRYGGQWVVLTVNEVHRNGRTYRTRERAGMIVPRGRLPPSQPSGGTPTADPTRPSDPAAVPGPSGPTGSPRSAGSVTPRGGAEGRLAVGERLRVRASVGEARWSDSLGRQPPVVLRNPIIEGRAPPGGAALRISERVRDAARSRALASLTPERAGLLIGMALGDTSLLPAELERDFRAAGLTHLMAVSGANLAVVLAAGLWLAGAAGVGRRGLAVVGILLVVVLVVVTRWEPSVLRAGVMAGLVLLGVATGRGPGGRRALSLAVVVLLLADPSLAGALGFQLSVVATAGVLWLGPATASALPDRVPERIRRGVGMTLGAQATAVPALALTFGSVSLAGAAGQPPRPAARGRPDAPGRGRRRHRTGRAVGRDPRLPSGRPVPPRADRGRPLGRGPAWWVGRPRRPGSGRAGRGGPPRVAGGRPSAAFAILAPPRRAANRHREDDKRDEMITADELRQVVRSLPEAEERETWGHPTFRVRDRMFAAMSDDGQEASVKATRQEQAALVSAAPETFGIPAYVGRHGWVSIQLATVDPAEVRELIVEAWRQTAPKRLVAAYDSGRSS